MEKISIENQPIFSKLLNKINKCGNFSQAYILVCNDKSDLKEYSFFLSKVLVCPHEYCQNCDKCNICGRIDKNLYGELIVVNPTSGMIKKESILNIRNKFNSNSVEGKNQIYIINDIETLNSSAANSLLKFLEEPESNTVAIFTTSNLNLVYDTIISRCQVIKLNDKIKNTKEYLYEKSNLLEEEIDFIIKYLITIETDYVSSISKVKEDVLKKFNTKELLKSFNIVLLLLYKDLFDYKLLGKTKYFNSNDVEKIVQINNYDQLIKKINFIIENIEKLDYNVNSMLYMSNLLIGIGEINNDKGSRN